MLDTFLTLFFSLFDAFESDEVGFFILGFCVTGVSFAAFWLLVWGARGGKLK